MNLLNHKREIENEDFNKHPGYLLSWQGPEYENYPKDGRWYLIAFSIIALIVIYALFTDSPLMAIVFILIGIVGYIYIERDPRVFDFAIIREGVLVGNELYDFDDIKSFWIFYHEPHKIILSLHTDTILLPYVHIPIHQVDSEAVRQILLKFIKEKKQQPSVIDTIERLLHI